MRDNQVLHEINRNHRFLITLSDETLSYFNTIGCKCEMDFSLVDMGKVLIKGKNECPVHRKNRQLTLELEDV